jgi:hypothetical protein
LHASSGERLSPIAVNTGPKLSGNCLPGELVQPGLGIEQVDVARAALHEQEDDALACGR